MYVVKGWLEGSAIWSSVHEEGEKRDFVREQGGNKSMNGRRDRWQ